MTRRLTIHKFGGTSLGDALAIKEAIEIIRSASRQGDVVVVVSAMSGVTNRLIDAAKRSKSRDYLAAATAIKELGQRHAEVLRSLVPPSAERSHTEQLIQSVMGEAELLCREISLSGDLTPQKLDAISSVGERLSAPLLALVLNKSGLSSEPVVASEVIRTNSRFGCAEPIIDATKERCRLRLRPLLRRGVIPVVTGFMGATENGWVTTLGRGGSDYSATILGTALAADEVVIWTDVNGFMTADPKLVPNARTIAELSYRQAAELARAGAKVLHPRALDVLAESGIPVSVRNTFAVDRPGTRIKKTASSPAATITGLAVLEHESGFRITLVGSELQLATSTHRLRAALSAEKINLIEPENEGCDHHISFVVSKSDLIAAANVIHTEFRLHESLSQVSNPQRPSIDPAMFGRSEAPVIVNSERYV